MREGPSSPKFSSVVNNNQLNFSSDGLEINNNNSYNPESAKANVRVRSGKWYYEVKLKAGGQMHIGWCTSKFPNSSSPSGAVGDDAESWAYDGSRQKKINQGNTATYGDYWSSGDVIGVGLDFSTKSVWFTRNGRDLGVAFNNVPNDWMFPAISATRRQSCVVNFGKTAFSYPKPGYYPLHLKLTDSQVDQLTKIFEKYKGVGVQLSESGETKDAIKGQGTLQLAQDLGQIDENDPLLLLLAWKLNAETVWEFSRDEFVTAFSLYECYTLDHIKSKVAQWRKEYTQQNEFRNFYNFVFDYLKEDRVILLLDEAIMAWNTVGLNTRWPMFEKWSNFLKSTDKKSISRDTWQQLLGFVEQYPKDLTGYDPLGSWPVVIDEFVERVQSGK